METTLKQRLIGAAVIIALAVIFVPMILDGSGREQSAALNMEVPPEPTFKFESELPDPKQLESLPEIENPKETVVDVKKAHSESDDKPDVEVKVEKTKNAQQEDKKLAKAPVEKVKKAVVATENQIKTNPALSAWAVQVAAFSEKDKALALEEKLLASNLSAFTEQSGSAGKTMYRVKVGPELQRDNAEQLRDKIEKEHGLKDSFVIKHP